MPGASAQADRFEQFVRPATAFANTRSGDAQGEFDVFVGREQG